MTTEELNQAVNAYLGVHLDSAFWGGLSEESKEASIGMATADILAELPGLAFEQISATSNALRAIAEQAVFLARNYSEMTANRAIANEAVEGISTTYRMVGSGQGVGHRAEVFIRAAKREMGKGSVRLARA